MFHARDFLHRDSTRSRRRRDFYIFIYDLIIYAASLCREPSFYTFPRRKARECVKTWRTWIYVMLKMWIIIYYYHHYTSSIIITQQALLSPPLLANFGHRH